MTNAGPYRNAQSQVQWQGAVFSDSQRDALGQAEAEAGSVADANILSRV